MLLRQPWPVSRSQEKCCPVGSALPPKVSLALSAPPSREGWVEDWGPGSPVAALVLQAPKSMGQFRYEGQARPGQAPVGLGISPVSPLGSQTLAAPCVPGSGGQGGGGTGE